MKSKKKSMWATIEKIEATKKQKKLCKFIAKVLKISLPKIITKADADYFIKSNKKAYGAAMNGKDTGWIDPVIFKKVLAEIAGY